ncbi:hypothetical protein WCE55_02200 [Luteimonas sp. MJ293]|uniref:hypothetical protein n=1 Tax=Luteimonas sp. MJ146 TaxID=3129240 RepID=UPI0031B9E6EE
MAEPVTLRVLTALQDELRRITVANGFSSDLGLWVDTEGLQSGIPTQPRTSVALFSVQRVNDAGSPDAGRSGEGVIEVMLPANYANAMAIVHRAIDDVERALDEMAERLQRGTIPPTGALVPIFMQAVILDRPEGLPVCAAEITWTTGWRRR